MKNLKITQHNIGYLRADISAWNELPSGHSAFGLRVDLPMFAYHLNMPKRSVLVDVPATIFPEEHANMMVPGSRMPTLLEQP
ncbi:MAG: hypothetical protein IIC78_10955 [Chloroflexi bacterium]|nr:hypothetical protein [Chloroflexota bacterium]